MRDLFRETEVRERDRRAASAKRVGVVAGLVVMAIFMTVQFYTFTSGLLKALALASGFGVAFGVSQALERRWERPRFPWLDSL